MMFHDFLHLIASHICLHRSIQSSWGLGGLDPAEADFSPSKSEDGLPNPQVS